VETRRYKAALIALPKAFPAGPAGRAAGADVRGFHSIS
jgi:hypothetical protein